MHKTERLVGVLRILLGLAFAALVLAQVVVLPSMSDDWVKEWPELAHSGWLLTVSVLELLCVQVVIVCTWRLLTMVKDDRIFSEASLAWVNVIVAAMAAAWVLLLGTFLYVVGPGGPPGPWVAMLLLMLVAGAVLGLLVVVMRALLRQATSLRTDMEAVI
jgi:Protein of unknown function (DUF2975)